MSDDSTKSGTFLVTAADEASAVLAAVEDGQVCPLAGNPGYEAGEVVEATIEPADPMGVTWQPVDVLDRWTPAVAALEEPPGERAREVGEDAATGQVQQLAVDDGELHVLAVEPGRTGEAVDDVVADETTLRIAARLGARRVEVRGADGVVAVRYVV